MMNNLNKNKKILVIDDDEELCEEVSGILEGEGYTVSTAFDGQQAKDLIDRGNFDLLLLDMKIPAIKGSEILKNIKAKNLKAKVIVLTGSPSVDKLVKKDFTDNLKVEAEEERALRLADAFFSKPFNIELLLAKIKDLIP